MWITKRILTSEYGSDDKEIYDHEIKLPKTVGIRVTVVVTTSLLIISITTVNCK